MIKRNPGVTAVWKTREKLRKFSDGQGGVLFDVGNPIGIEWYAHGRPAVRGEIMDSINSGLPILQGQAEAEGAEAVAALAIQTKRALRLVPA